MVNGQLIARVGPVLVAAAGAPPAALGAAVVLIAAGGATALALVGYGLFRRLSGQGS
jgi:hypothetical protein